MQGKILLIRYVLASMHLQCLIGYRKTRKKTWKVATHKFHVTNTKQFLFYTTIRDVCRDGVQKRTFHG